MSSFYISCCLLVIFVNCALGNITVKGPRCFKCEDRVDTTSCGNFTICGSHEQCYAERYLNSMGAPMVRQGCRAISMCNTKKRDTGVTCLECCHGNYCNSQGCGYSGFPQNSFTLGPLCLSCHSATSTQCFLHIERCASMEKCMYNDISQNSIVGCGGYHACLHHKCCTEDFCNDQYVFHRTPVNNNYVTTQSTKRTTIQTAPRSTYSSHWVSADGTTSSAMATTKPVIHHHTPNTIVTTRYVKPNTGLGPTCFSCQNVPHPSSCYNLTSCGQHEVCAVKQEINTVGSVYYWVGCMDPHMCANSLGKRTIDVCSQCCHGNHCNYHGCGETGYNHNSVDLGPMCFHCDATDDPSKCTKIKRCTANEVCYIERKSTNHNIALYTGGCKNKNVCHGDSSCCSTDLCNDKIHPLTYSSNTVPRTTVVVPNTSQWVTANQTKLLCLLCVTHPEVATITCNNLFKTCTANEACYRDTTLVGSRRMYTFGCTNKALCKQTHHQTNDIFGKRSGVNKRYSSIRTCCFEDNCNAKGVNLVATTLSAGLTVASTVSSTRITTPSTVATGRKPVITYITPSMTLHTGSSGIFVCKATGEPLPIIEWSGPIHHSHPSTNVNEETIHNSILLTKVTTDNSGYYTCVAYNVYGVTQQTVHLSVV